MNRQEAVLVGAKRYRGKPCKTCGGTEKFVSSYSCTSCTTARTASRDPNIGRRYASSERGRSTRKRYKKTKVYREIQNRYHRKRYASDPSIYKERNRKSYERHADKRSDYARFRAYGLSKEEYLQKLAEQDYRCEICGTHQDQLTYKLAVDHKHDTGKIRDLLCAPCNMALGLLKENISTMTNMIAYLRKHALCPRSTL